MVKLHTDSLRYFIFFFNHGPIDQQSLTEARGLGVGRRPPPGIIPATALAGASSDIALDSSGMTPGEKQGF